MAPRVKTECAQDCYKPRAVRTTSFLIFGLSTLAVLIFFALCVNSSRERPCSSSPYSPGEPADSCSPAPSMFTAFTTWSDSQYFVAAYLPTLLAVIYNILWEVIYTGLAEMEPFIQLAKDGGVSAQASLSLRYATTSLPVTFYLAIVNYHPNIICASFISFILAISVPFASEVLHIGTQGVCNSTAGGNNCTPYVQIRPAIARMEVVFTAITLFGVIALAYGYGNQTGIRNEGSSIAGLATLLNDTLH
ncbi:hypothetical protein UA08_05978 [Talaromyces atroroseus]|uniref:Uncharacterized protein n=1 Tax=Talaromyces atroroseus TaxID=1441469 RepID=A0A225AH19_TALAT|nr:hypothetical protein UA08_05978 [Talaromyces atroroseus]OKL58513.1 hypothetical protein UA08_05978 [Talaromyces atroroseus]